MDKLRNKYLAQSTSLDDEDNRYTKYIKQFDNKFLNSLVKFHRTITGDKINIGELGDIIETINRLYKIQKDNYLEALLYPEYAQNVRIPRIVPVRASSFKSTYEFRFPANATGAFCFCFNPYFANTASNTTTAFLNNNAALTGNAVSPFFIGVDIGWLLSPIYSEACLVSHSLVVEAQVSNNNAQGTIVSGIVHDNLFGNNNVGDVNSALSKYGNFTLARTGFFNDSVNVSETRGIRTIGFPLDNSYEEFLNPQVQQVKKGFGHVVTGIGLPPAATIVVRIVANWEALPDPAFTNFVSSSFGPSYEGSDRKSEDIKMAQMKPITPYSNLRSDRENYLTKDNEEVGVFQTIKNFARDYLPSIGEIASFLGSGLIGGPIGEGLAIGGALTKGIGSMFQGNTPGGGLPDLKFIPINK